jgi:hypothetical protein
VKPKSAQLRRSRRRPRPTPNLNDALGGLFGGGSISGRKRKRGEAGRSSSATGAGVSSKNYENARESDSGDDEDCSDGDGVGVEEIASNAAYFAKQLVVANVRELYGVVLLWFAPVQVWEQCLTTLPVVCSQGPKINDWEQEDHLNALRWALWLKTNTRDLKENEENSLAEAVRTRSNLVHMNRLVDFDTLRLLLTHFQIVSSSFARRT